MNTGTLVYDSNSDRLAICYHNLDLDHLHCGDCIEVLRTIITEDYKEVWIPTRVEYSHKANDWYLVDMFKPGSIQRDLTVRRS
jgi:hypothetical protein